jgi:hypothetical protein
METNDNRCNCAAILLIFNISPCTMEVTKLIGKANNSIKPLLIECAVHHRPMRNAYNLVTERGRKHFVPT